MDIQVMNLVKDEYLECIGELPQGFDVGIDPDKIYRLTPKGIEFIQHWSNAANLE
jgi:DNA-binding PadR family transcriptional regulator